MINLLVVIFPILVGYRIHQRVGPRISEDMNRATVFVGTVELHKKQSDFICNGADHDV
jgi:hypothetical protein